MAFSRDGVIVLVRRRVHVGLMVVDVAEGGRVLLLLLAPAAVHHLLLLLQLLVIGPVYGLSPFSSGGLALGFALSAAAAALTLPQFALAVLDGDQGRRLHDAVAALWLLMLLLDVGRWML